MAKYQVGDRVVVRDDIVPDDGTVYYMENRIHHNTFVSGMSRFCGKVVTIKNKEYAQYQIEECNYNWTDEMFAGLESEVFTQTVSVEDLL